MQQASIAARRFAFLFLLCALNLLGADDPLAAWRNGVVIRPVAPALSAHSIHAYFNLSSNRWTQLFVAERPSQPPSTQ